MLNQEEINRYARHIVLKEVGGAGQAKLKAAKVLVLGAGGLGCPVLLYLAAAGIGTIGVVDDDVVTLSNLQRQVLFKTEDIGQLKVDIAKAQCEALNPNCKIITHATRLDELNAKELVSHYDLVVDGSDNFATRNLIASSCEFAQKPLIMGMIGRFDGYITTLKPFVNNNPTYQCLYPEQPAAGLIPACSEAGVIGALTGIIGSIMALEVVRELCGFGENLVGKQLIVNAMTWEMDKIIYGRL